MGPGHLKTRKIPYSSSCVIPDGSQLRDILRLPHKQGTIGSSRPTPFSMCVEKLIGDDTSRPGCTSLTGSIWDSSNGHDLSRSVPPGESSKSPGTERRMHKSPCGLEFVSDWVETGQCDFFSRGRIHVPFLLVESPEISGIL